jgi:hypothetical protein
MLRCVSGARCQSAGEPASWLVEGVTALMSPRAVKALLAAGSSPRLLCKACACSALQPRGAAGAAGKRGRAVPGDSAAAEVAAPEPPKSAPAPPPPTLLDVLGAVAAAGFAREVSGCVALCRSLYTPPPLAAAAGGAAGGAAALFWRAVIDMPPPHVAGARRRPTLTRLASCARRGRTARAVALLLARGASVNCKDGWGLSPLE